MPRLVLDAVPATTRATMLFAAVHAAIAAVVPCSTFATRRAILCGFAHIASSATGVALLAAVETALTVVVVFDAASASAGRARVDAAVANAAPAPAAAADVDAGSR